MVGRGAPGLDRRSVPPARVGGDPRARMQNGNGSRPRIGVVLPGGGARGAYEAGALSVLLPALEERGERVSIYCGTSVGAINAVLFASLAGLAAADQVEAASERWRGLRRPDVLGPIIGPHLALTVARFV